MPHPIPDLLPLDDGLLDLRVGSIDRPHGRVSLTTRELALLRYLAARPDEPASRDQLLVDVWEYAPGVESRTVDTTVKRLRKKLEADPKAPRHLVSVHGVGYRLVAAAASQDPTPPPPDLPADTDAFVGRAADLVAIVQALQSSAQLVTLRGPGGVGKSRLAREVARLRSAEGDAIVSVDLSSARCEDDVRGEVNVALGLSPTAGDDELIEALTARVPALVLLDQADASLGALRGWMPRLARGAPSAVALVTARQRVGLPGEVELRVDPLPPDEAVALFRARASHPGDDATVALLAEALDGLPLALELAAGRTSVLSPAEILARLDQRFRLLTDRSTGRRLEDTIAWSWEALDDDERAALTAFAVFRGGFDLPAAEAVAGAVVGDWVLDLVDALESRSLLHRRQRSVGSRFFLLESVRSYAEGAGSPEVLQTARAAHRTWAVQRGRTLDADVDGPDARGAIAALHVERANLHAAWAAAPPGTDRAELAAVLAGLQEHTGSTRAGLEVVVTTLADDAELPAALAGRLRLAHARLAQGINDLSTARAEAEAALALCDDDDSPAGHAVLARATAVLALLDGETDAAEAGCARLEAMLARLPDDRSAGRLQLLHRLGLARFHLGRLEEADEVAQELFSHARATGRPLLEGDARRLLGSVQLRRGNIDAAWTQSSAAAALFATAGDSAGEAVCVELQGVIRAFSGDFGASAERYRHALAIYRRLGRRHELPRALCNLARVLLHQGHAADARAAAEDAVALAREQGALRQELGSLTLLGTVALSEGRLDEALALYVDAVEGADRTSLPQMQGAARACLAIARLLEGEVGLARDLNARALELAESAGDRLAVAHHHATAAAIEAEAGQPDRAQERLDQAIAAAPPGKGRPWTWIAHCEAFIDCARWRAGEGAARARVEAALARPSEDAFGRAMARTLRERLAAEGPE